MWTSPLFRALGCVWLAGLLASCNWEPHARDAQPQQLVSGPAHVVRVLDGEGRHALFTLGRGADQRFRILNSDTRQSCELPATDTPIGGIDPLLAPNLRGDDVAQFWLPMLRTDPSVPVPDPNAPPAKALFFSDEKCTVIGPFGLAQYGGWGTVPPAPGGPRVLTLRGDRRTVLLVPGPDAALSLVDPWTRQVRSLSQAVSTYDSVDQAEASSAPQAIWLLEGGKLTQRALDGTLLLSLGSAVSQFSQALLQGVLRVAYTDGGSLFEAKGPDFRPVLIATDACDPGYNGAALDLHTPCTPAQLVRIDLVTGTIKRFSPGVVGAFNVGEISFESQVGADGSGQLWVVSGTARTQLSPIPSGSASFSVLDRTRVAGRIDDRGTADVFGVWSVAAGFKRAFADVSSMATFRDQRTNRLLWLMLYQLDQDGIGRLVGFDQSELDRVIAGTQTTPPMVLSERVLVGSYRVYLQSVLPEPMILTLEPPITLSQDGVTRAGELNARLLSGSLASKIDEGVSSFEVALSPYPGILYGILDGPRAGLWFAAL
ncbi:MAG: hypothetical protein JWN48_231 [Myxococcaceae bacterium]|nr:hypothetical protein [Myxococcaceae bacterium]